MKNIFVDLKEKYENNKNENLKYFKDLGFNENQIKECFEILNLRKNILFKESNNNIKISGDATENYSNGYSNGLYKGAVDQTEHIIGILLEKKIYNIVCGISKLKSVAINLQSVINKMKNLYKIDQLLLFIFEDAEDDYDINLAFKFESTQSDYEKEYYIVYQKDKGSKYPDCTLIDIYNIQTDYTLTDEEKHKIDKYLTENNIL